MRFTDDRDNIQLSVDFVSRKQRPSLWAVVTVYAFSILTIFLVSYYRGEGNWLGSMLLITIVVAALAFYSLYIKQGYLDQIIATQFQNALLSAAAGQGAAFCMILKRDGTVVHADNGIREMFPHFAHNEAQALQALLEEGGVSEVDQKRIFMDLQQGKGDRLIFSIERADGEKQEFILTITPLKRPPDFFVIRGRPFVANREGQLVRGEEDKRALHAVLASHLLDEAAIGLFAAYSDGKIAYINHLTEEQMGYGRGEVMARHLSLRDMLYQLGSGAIQDPSPEPYEGEALLERKNGSLSKVYIVYKHVYNDQEQMIGSIASILNHG